MPRIKILASLIISSFALTACNSDTEVLDVEENKLYTSSRIQFDPSNGIVSLPNDLLFSGTTDGTLQLPDETAAIEAASGAVITYDDNTYAIGALDGWSTTQPIVIGVDLYEDRTLDAASVTQVGAVHIFKVSLGGPLSTSAVEECKLQDSLTVCVLGGLGTELTYGTDFITAVNGNSIAVVPLKPFAEKASYMYLTTDLIKDSEGESVNGSVTYQLLKRDYAENPIGDPSNPADEAAVGLQHLVNHYDDIITAFTIDASTVTHTGVFTTQSITDVISTVQGVMAGNTPGFTPIIDTHPTDTTATVAAALSMTLGDPRYTAANATKLYSAAITLPYFLSKTSPSSYWNAVGDSPITILGAVAKGFVSDAVLQGACGQTIAAASANPALLVGCSALNLDAGYRHLTRYNPLPAPNGTQAVSVQITVPNGTKPPLGWPVNIAVHGLGTLKETTLQNAGALAAQGVATIAIDMPLHGSRGFDVGDSDGVFELSATDPSLGASYAKGTALTFINMNSGLTVRDNFRQAIVDLLALRKLIPTFNDPDGGKLFNASLTSVHGLSLGAITAATFTANANNTAFIDGISGAKFADVYGIQTASLVAPTGGLAWVFNESPTFGPILMDQLVQAVAALQGIDFTIPEQANSQTDEEYNSMLAAIRQSSGYQALEAAADSELVPGMLFSLQTQVDAIDPINTAAMLAVNTPSLHVIEVVGDGGDNLADQVLPNSGSVPVTGTEALIANLGLGCVDQNTVSPTKGAVRFEKGHHSSLINPLAVENVTAGDEFAATLEMQAQVATFASGATAGQMTVTDGSVLKPCS
ncbi:MAG: lipase [Moritella sp.]|uniref:VolA/Pla-1 family phospholipase n=1 Tax=Moritella sp. TaxID=78556 RepID=UPI0025DCD2C5|nr:VolA/Pla-1 family phospholipase [Moritella sp.]NQZ91060.1 lipase [Moritella sp.]